MASRAMDAPTASLSTSAHAARSSKSRRKSLSGHNRAMVDMLLHKEWLLDPCKRLMWGGVERWYWNGVWIELT